MKRTRSVAAALAVGAVLAGCGDTSAGDVGQPAASAKSKAVTVTVTLKEFSVTLSRSSVPAGTPVRFNVVNEGKMTHELVLEPAGLEDEPMEQNGAATELEDIEPGTSRTATWTLPNAGGYDLACYVPGHFEAGMVATVEAS
jgi:uncharacterized cupredoxin-like copper-binding protein